MESPHIQLCTVEIISQVIAHQTESKPACTTQCDQKVIVSPNFSLTSSLSSKKNPRSHKSGSNFSSKLPKRTHAGLFARQAINFLRQTKPKPKVSPITVSGCGTTEGLLIKFQTLAEREGKLTAQPIWVWVLRAKLHTLIMVLRGVRFLTELLSVPKLFHYFALLLRKKFNMNFVFGFQISFWELALSAIALICESSWHTRKELIWSFIWFVFLNMFFHENIISIISLGLSQNVYI